MKRLSKSASDISNCKKKTYSTSPEEEEREFDHEGLYGKRAIRHDDDEGNTLFQIIFQSNSNLLYMWSSNWLCNGMFKINSIIGEWENTERPASAASSFSSPIGLGLDADGIRSSSRSAKSEGHGSRRKKERQKHGKKHAFAEVGIRSIGDQIHSSYKGKCLQFWMFSNTGDLYNRLLTSVMNIIMCPFI